MRAAHGSVETRIVSPIHIPVTSSGLAKILKVGDPSLLISCPTSIPGTAMIWGLRSGRRLGKAAAIQGFAESGFVSDGDALFVGIDLEAGGLTDLGDIELEALKAVHDRSTDRGDHGREGSPQAAPESLRVVDTTPACLSPALRALTAELRHSGLERFVASFPRIGEADPIRLVPTPTAWRIPTALVHRGRLERDGQFWLVEARHLGDRDPAADAGSRLVPPVGLSDAASPFMAGAQDGAYELLVFRTDAESIDIAVRLHLPACGPAPSGISLARKLQASRDVEMAGDLFPEGVLDRPVVMGGHILLGGMTRLDAAQWTWRQQRIALDLKHLQDLPRAAWTDDGRIWVRLTQDRDLQAAFRALDIDPSVERATPDGGEGARNARQSRVYALLDEDTPEAIIRLSLPRPGDIPELARQICARQICNNGAPRDAALSFEVIAARTPGASATPPGREVGLASALRTPVASLVRAELTRLSAPQMVADHDD